MTTGDSQGRKLELVISVSILTGLGTVVILARMYTRYFIMRRVGKDDWAIIIGWFFTIAYLAEIFLGAKYGFGRSTKDVTLPDLVRLIKIGFAIQITYYIASAAIKISILLLYIRIFREFFMLRRLWYATIALIIMTLCVWVIVTLLQCVPLRKIWDITGTVPGKCINITVFFYIPAVFNIIADIWIVCLPIKLVSKIRRPRKEKLFLFGIFGMGAFASVASVIRLYSIRIIALSSDQSYHAIAINIWSMAELNVGMICASVPALKPLFSNGSNRGASISTTRSTKMHKHSLSGSTAAGSYTLSPLSTTYHDGPEAIKSDSQLGQHILGTSLSDKRLTHQASQEMIFTSWGSAGDDVERGGQGLRSRTPLYAESLEAEVKK